MPALLDEYADYLRANSASDRTVETRVQTMRTLMKHAEVTDPLLLTRRQVVAFLGRPLTRWTRHTYWLGINRWVRWCRDFEIADLDLLKGFDRPAQPEPTARPVDDITISRLLHSPMRPRTRAYVVLALYAGLRVHEVAKIRGEDFDAGLLTVTGKGEITKTIPVHPEVQKLVDVMPSRGWWFPSPTVKDAPVCPRSVTVAIASAFRAIGSDATAHRLRDTAATFVQRSQGDIRVTQRFLRHKQVSTTQKYTAVSDSDLKSAVESMRWDAA